MTKTRKTATRAWPYLGFYLQAGTLRADRLRWSTYGDCNAAFTVQLRASDPAAVFWCKFVSRQQFFQWVMRVSSGMPWIEGSFKPSRYLFDLIGRPIPNFGNHGLHQNTDSMASRNFEHGQPIFLHLTPFPASQDRERTGSRRLPAAPPPSRPCAMPRESWRARPAPRWHHRRSPELKWRLSIPSCR